VFSEAINDFKNLFTKVNEQVMKTVREIEK
jgi:hypothetical protein